MARLLRNYHKTALRETKVLEARGLGTKLLLLLTFLALGNGLYAQTTTGSISHWSLDGGISSSDILIEGLSFGLILDPRIALSSKIMVGAKNIINFSSNDIVALETQAYLRWNFLGLGNVERPTNLFVQGGAGLLAVYRGSDVTYTRGSVLADITGGITIPLNDRWHIEPSVRAGYPFIVGAGLTAGIRFPLKQNTRTEFIEVVKRPPSREIVRTIMITLVEYIIFGPDRPGFNDEVDADARSLNNLVIETVAKTLRENPDFVVRIEGHANPVTRVPEEIEELLLLSEARANTVADLLRENGVNDEQIVVVALGGTRVLASDHAYWNMNRRVELMVFQHLGD